MSPRRPSVGFSVLVVAVATAGSPSAAQETRPARNESDLTRGTILNPEFARKLADAELNLPTDESIDAAQHMDTEYARYDCARWQDIVLAQPFRAVSFPRGSVRETGTEFTAGVSPGGYDSVYYQWETDDYWLQFHCTRQKISVMAEPKSVGARSKLSAREVEERAAATMRKIVKHGSALLANSTMKIESTEFGYLIRFPQGPGQFDGLRRDYPETERATFLWLIGLTIRTDGYSFVVDCPKVGVGPTVPTKDKTWFNERKPGGTARP